MLYVSWREPLPALGSFVTSEEKNTWIFALATVCSYVAYLATVVGRAKGIPLHEVAYVAPMLWAIGGGVAATIVGYIVVASIWRDECGKKDVRDREIHRFGEYVGQSMAVRVGSRRSACPWAR
jgi:hypothetical protein